MAAPTETNHREPRDADVPAPSAESGKRAAADQFASVVLTHTANRVDELLGDMEDLSPQERDALHELQLGVEHVYRAYGRLLGFHHSLGRGMDHLAEAERLLRDCGHDHHADDLRDSHLPAGAIGDQWSYELVEDFQHGFLDDVTGFEDDVRADLAGGKQHVTERRQQREWRDRADDED